MRLTSLGRSLLLLAGIGCTGEVPSVVGETVAELSAAVPNVPAALVGERALAAVTDAGPYLGFDTYAYPGDRAMQAWRAAGRYDWVGYYLSAPCHKDGSWMGKRERLERDGWGLAVLYVGQQTWGKTPRPTARVAPGTSCSTHMVSGPRGWVEGEDAIRRTAAEGFPPGTVIFLDIEHMDAVPAAMRDYYSAWTARVLADGRYRPGYYAHTRNAERIYADVKAVFAQAGVRAEPSFWIAGGGGFGPGRDPSHVGHSFAAVWQGVLDTWGKHNGVRLQIDVNVASVPSPSSHEYALGE